MGQKATIYRMVMKEHICPFGLKARDLLVREGFEVDDHRLRTREQTDAFMREQGVETTPQVFIQGVRIGGHDDLRRKSIPILWEMLELCDSPSRDRTMRWFS